MRVLQVSIVYVHIICANMNVSDHLFIAVLILSYKTVSDTVEALEDLIRDKIGHKYKEKIDMVSHICLIAIFYIIYPLMWLY